MTTDIKQNLTDRFAQPIAENYTRRIIFWKDPAGEFLETAEDMCPENVKFIRLTGSNNFDVKRTLSETDTESDYLVYDPLSYENIKDDWLLDVKLYSEEFRADLISMRMKELGMTDSVTMRQAVREYSKFFENRERVTRLKGFGNAYSDVRKFHVDVLAVLSSAKENTMAGVIKALLMSGMDPEENAALSNIKKFGNEDILWDYVSKYTGYVYEEGRALDTLASHILITALSVTMRESVLKGLEKLISDSHKQTCYSFIDDWLHSEEDDALYEIARAVEREYDLAVRFDSADISDLISSECFPCINECILRRFMTDISDNVIKAEDIINVVEKRRTLKWYKRVRHYYEGLYYAALMQQFHVDHADGFHVAEYAVLWKKYCKDYSRMDHYYRMFHLAFSHGIKESTTVIDDLFKSVADYVENMYKNWYLSTLGAQWTKLVSDELEKSSRLEGIVNQADFYRRYVEPLAENSGRVYVIVSDALRYEVGDEIKEKLLKETRGDAKISSMQAVFPSNTKFGKAALLPHRKLTINDGIKVFCDGGATEGTKNREIVLKKACDGNVALTYKTLLSMKQSERRSAVSDAKVVYIYHNSIDAVGDKTATEDQVFDACDQAVKEICNLVRMITNDLSGTNILITSDHGFLYSYKPLDESDKAEKSLINGSIVELDRRYVIVDGECSAEHMIKIPMDHVGSDLSGFAPLDYIRIKKPGGGMNYVHGGISLQESVVPVIEFKNMRASSKKFVDVTKPGLKLVSQSRKVSNSIFSLDFYQENAVAGKVKPAEYEVFMADITGEAVSDKKTVIADKTSADSTDRVFRVRFTLKSMDFQKTEKYYLMIVDKEEKATVEKTEFSIDIAFVNDFDF